MPSCDLSRCSGLVLFIDLVGDQTPAVRIPRMPPRTRPTGAWSTNQTRELGKGDADVQKLREWREVIFQELIVLGFVSSGVLIMVDLLAPETRLRGLALFLGMVTCTATVVWIFKRDVVKTWEAGGRAEKRRAELEAAETPAPLKVVREVAPR